MLSDIVLTCFRYKHIPAKPRSEASGMVAQTLPMAAMFMKNKMLSWAALFLAVQSYLNQPTNRPADDKDSQPPILRILFSLISLVTCYLEFIFPSASPAVKRAPVNVAETLSSTIAAATSTN